MKKTLQYVFLLISCFSLGCSGSDDSGQSPDPDPDPSAYFCKGMDLSFQPELENYNVTYKDPNGNPIELLDYVADRGTNLVRLRLWHTPVNGLNGLDAVKAYSQRVKAKGMDVFLDIHYSDSWADPGQQTPPLSWQLLTFEQVKSEVYLYTKNVVQQLKTQNTLPKIIQIGNETDSGFLWDYGRVWDAFSDNWPNYATLVNEAIRAIREVDTQDQVKIMLHHSSVENAIYFFNEIKDFNLDFDIIGLSYYPQFQTHNLSVVQSKMNQLATTFDKDILLAEVAYPFTLEWDDNATNYIGNTSQILSEFPATPAGQKAYFERLTNIIKNIPNNRGIGFCYWAPDWVAFDGNGTTSTGGSAWENQCVFDFEHKALPVFEVFENN